MQYNGYLVTKAVYKDLLTFNAYISENMKFPNIVNTLKFTKNQLLLTKMIGYITMEENNPTNFDYFNEILSNDKIELLEQDLLNFYELI